MTHAGGLDTAQGYGVAGEQIVSALQRLGHTTPFNRAESPIGFNFTQPYYFAVSYNQYKIGYTPWESTQLHDGWLDSMNMMDEIWTTSDWCAKYFALAGVKPPIYVYEHGIDHKWSNFRRKPGKVLKFLHHGEPATRKCGPLVFQAFTELFGNDERYSLTIKSNGMSTIRAKRLDNTIARPEEVYKNVRVVPEMLELEQLISLYHMHDVLVYPSFGEGFGLIPLQGMATGMPVILNPTWAPYRDFSVGLDVEDSLVDSPWPNLHPGKMLEPSLDSIKEQMLCVAIDFERYSDEAYETSPAIHEAYDWTDLTRIAFAHVSEKVSVTV